MSSPLKKINDKQLEQIMDRAIHEWKLLNGTNALPRAYYYAVCVWLKEEGLLVDIPEYQSRTLSIDSCID